MTRSSTVALDPPTLLQLVSQLDELSRVIENPLCSVIQPSDLSAACRGVDQGHALGQAAQSLAEEELRLRDKASTTLARLSAILSRTALEVTSLDGELGAGFVSLPSSGR